MVSRRVFLKNGAFALVSLGFAPSFLARTAFAAGDSRRARAAHRDLSARRGRWPEHGRTVRRGRVLSRPPEHRRSPPQRRRRKRARSRRLLRLQPASQPAQTALGSPRPGDRSCVRFARLDPLALRRPGLHGDGDARASRAPGTAGSTAISRRGGPKTRRRFARSRSASSCPVSCRAPRRRIAVNQISQFGIRSGGDSETTRRIVRSAVRRRGRSRAERHRPRSVRRDQDAEGCRSFEVPAGARRRVPAQSVRAGIEADRAVDEGRRRSRSGVRRHRRMGHTRQPGRGPGAACRRGSTTSRAASRRS